MKLIPDRPFDHPLRLGDRHYVPILKSMPGEFMALTRAFPETWDRLTPLIEATGQAAVGEPPRSSRFIGLPRRLAAAIKAEHPFFLDFPWVDSRARINVGKAGAKTATNAIEYVFEECRNLGLTFVPVLRPDHDQRRRALTRRVVECDGRGVCIRVPVAGRVWQDLSQAVEGLRSELGASHDQTDLLLDLGYIPLRPGFTADHIRRLIATLPRVAEWRSLILAGSVIPASGAGWPEGGITEVPRHEQAMYEDLIGAALARRPTFGDYCVQHPEPPTAGGPGMRANIRYTINRLVLFARGYSVLEHGAQQYQELAAMLGQRPEFSGSGYSWGDAIIADTAADRIPPKGEPQWRGAGTSHHLRLVAEWTSLL